MEKNIYCSKCGTKEGNFIRYSKSRDGLLNYYNCRACNTARAKKYRKTDSGKLAIRRAVAKSTKKYWYKQLARLRVHAALKRKLLIRPKICSQCKEKAKIEGHHTDYSKPLQVIWTCRQCHIVLDRELEKC